MDDAVLFDDLAAASEAVAATSLRNAKVATLAGAVKGLAPDEVAAERRLPHEERHAGRHLVRREPLEHARNPLYFRQPRAGCTHRVRGLHQIPQQHARIISNGLHSGATCLATSRS